MSEEYILRVQYYVHLLILSVSNIYHGLLLVSSSDQSMKETHRELNGFKCRQ